MRLSSLYLAVILAAGIPISTHAETIPDLPVITNKSLSLREALALASVNTVSLKQVTADFHAANASAKAAQAQTQPGISATTYATAGDSSNILTSSPGVVPQNIFAVTPRGFADQNIMLMAPILTGNRLGNIAKAARLQREAVGLSVHAGRLTTADMVTEAYTSAALQGALVETSQSRLTTEDEQVRITQTKVNTGRSAPVELLREQAEQADARQELIAATNSEALAMADLKAALGISQLSEISLQDTLAALADTGYAAPPTLQDALHLAATHRPELAVAQKMIDAASSNVSAARGAYAPQVYGVAMADATTSQGSARTGYTLGITASLPLYDARQRRADTESAQAKLERARADALQARITLEQQVTSAWLTLQTANAERDASAAGVTAAQEAYHLATLRYNAGKSVAAERLDALAALTRAQGAVAQAIANISIARARLQAALGEE